MSDSAVGRFRTTCRTLRPALLAGVSLALAAASSEAQSSAPRHAGAATSQTTSHASAHVRSAAEATPGSSGPSGMSDRTLGRLVMGGAAALAVKGLVVPTAVGSMGYHLLQGESVEASARHTAHDAAAVAHRVAPLAHTLDARYAERVGHATRGAGAAVGTALRQAQADVHGATNQLARSGPTRPSGR